MVLPVSKIMRKKVATCSTKATVLDACKILKKFKTSTVIIIDNKKQVLGVFSERDLVNNVVCAKKDPAKTPISEVMTTPVICGDVSQNDVQISNLIISKKVKKVPILKEGKLVGIVAESDVLRCLAKSVLEG